MYLKSNYFLGNGFFSFYVVFVPGLVEGVHLSAEDARVAGAAGVPLYRENLNKYSSSVFFVREIKRLCK